VLLEYGVDFGSLAMGPSRAEATEQLQLALKQHTTAVLPWHSVLQLISAGQLKRFIGDDPIQKLVFVPRQSALVLLAPFRHNVGKDATVFLNVCRTVMLGLGTQWNGGTENGLELRTPLPQPDQSVWHVQANVGVDRRPGGGCAKRTEALGRPCRTTC
jgi:hypothetical protein